MKKRLVKGPVCAINKPQPGGQRTRRGGFPSLDNTTSRMKANPKTMGKAACGGWTEGTISSTLGLAETGKAFNLPDDPSY